MATSTVHFVTVDGNGYEFLMVPASSSGYMVHAPGLVPFSAESLTDARDKLRSAYTEPQEPDFIPYPSWTERNNDDDGHGTR